MTTTTPAEQTVNCDIGQHDWCDGYVAPLVYAGTRPCFCRCHDYDNLRNLARGIESAEASHNGEGGER